MKKRVHLIDKSKGYGDDKVSTFFVSINTNSQDLISEERLKEVATLFFQHIEKFFRFLNKKHPERNNLDYIDDIDIQSAVETGKKEKRVHLHLLLKVMHRTKTAVGYQEDPCLLL
jgi:hypothetical protein